MTAGERTARTRTKQVAGAPEALVVDEAEGLGCIGWPGIALVIWRRPVPQELVRRVDAAAFEELPRARLEAVATEEVGTALAHELGARADVWTPLLADIAHLARLYGGIARLPAIRLRLEAIRDDACRRFHADQVRVRLLCTYRGPATEWIPRTAVRRATDGFVAEPDPAAVRRLERFEVGLFAGALAPLACVHRSPPLSVTGRDRLLLVIDEGADGGLAC